MGLGNFTAVCTYIYLQCFIHLKNGIAREYFEILAKIFKVSSSRFGMVIYVFFPVFYQLQVFALSTKIWRYVVNLLQHICHRISKNHPKYGRSWICRI